jgi:hypothetical protein
VLLARFTGFDDLHIAASSQTASFRNAIPPVDGKLLAPFAVSMLFGSGRRDNATGRVGPRRGLLNHLYDADAL